MQFKALNNKRILKQFHAFVNRYVERLQMFKESVYNKHDSKNEEENFMKRTRFIIFAILTFVWLGVIYSFSLETAEVSDGTSLGLIDTLVQNFLPWLEDEFARLTPVQMGVLHNFVRKCAHFTEYMILGVLATITLLQTDLRRKGLYSVVFCVVAASVDETIQVFVEGRAGMIQDVVLDSIGAAVGAGVVFLILRLCKCKRSVGH